MDRGDMIPDTLVGDLLLETLLAKSCKAPAGAATECGVLVDGFPRTAAQVQDVTRQTQHEQHAVT